MSLLPNATFSAPGVPLYGGGGGGGGSNIPVITNVSTITAGPGGYLDISGQFNIFSKGFANSNVGFEVYNGGGNTTVAQADFDAGAGGQGAIGNRGYSTIAGNQVIDTIFTMQTDNARNGKIQMQHEFAGVSSIGYINFANTGDMTLSALPPASGGAGSAINLLGNSSTIVFQPQGAKACHFAVPVSTNSYLPQAGTTQNLGSFPTTVGNLYDVRLPVRIDAVATPAVGDWALITTDTATAPVALATFDMVQISTIANQYELHLCGSVVASGTTTTIQALGKAGAGTSTALTVAGSKAYIRDLGLPQAP